MEDLGMRPRTPYLGHSPPSGERNMHGNHSRSDKEALHLTYDEGADAVYVYFTRNEVDHTDELSDSINVDYDAAGEPVGVEFLDVSDGIEVDDVPRRDDVLRLLDQGHFRVYA